MQFNSHWNLKDKHAFLSPSQYHWIRYDDEKLIERFHTSLLAKRGTEEHEYASTAIRLRIKQAATKKTLNLFVNDVLAAKMESEKTLFYSDNCFGTADAIGFRRNREGNYVLRIYDLKTGVSPAKVDQLLVYAALFCHEYGIKPFDILYDLRIYQSNEIACYETDPKEVADIMAQIIHFDRIITDIKEEEIG